LALISRFRGVTAAAAAADGNATGAPVVHCSAGIGRTGTFCVIDTLLTALAALVAPDDTDSGDGGGDGGDARVIGVDCYELVRRFRFQRPFMVQTRGQYTFCHDFVARCLRNGQLGVSTSAKAAAVADASVAGTAAGAEPDKGRSASL
jgi:protein tyrosine phosphatase